MSSGSSSPSTPPHRGLVSEFFSSLVGIGELAFGRPCALQRFTLTLDGFWRAFVYASVVFPILLSVAQSASHGGLLWTTMVVGVLSTVAGMSASIIVSVKVHGILRHMAFSGGRRSGGEGAFEKPGPSTLPFLVPFLWAFMVQTLLVLLLVMGDNGGAALFLEGILLITALVAQWRAARNGLALSGGRAAVMVAAYFGVQMVCNYVLLAMLSLVQA